MPHFRYKAANSVGKILNGVIEADSLQDAQYRISGRGLRPVEVQAAVLPKPRKIRAAAEGGSRMGLWITLVLLLAAAGATFWWFDPLGWFRHP